MKERRDDMGDFKKRRNEIVGWGTEMLHRSPCKFRLLEMH